MNSSNPPHPSSSETNRLSDEEKADLICLAFFPSTLAAHQAGTVLLTQSCWYAVFQSNDQWGLYVRSAIAEEAAQWVEQSLNDITAATIPAPELTTPNAKPVAPWHLIPAPLVLMIMFALSTSEKGSALVDAGRFDSVRILGNGEWWRLASPLFFHADTTHLLGNLLGGLLFGGLLATRVGATNTYLIALLTGITGNGLNLLAYQNTPHLSIGASTAVFGLLGALTGLRVRDRLRSETQTRHIPVAHRQARLIRYGVLGLGLVMLGWMGTGGERTDVPAHFYGFVSGVILLFFSRRFKRPTELIQSPQRPDDSPHRTTTP